MGCRSKRKIIEVRPEQKWDYITLNDFKSNSCFTIFAYIYLYISLIISVAVYGVDTFTAVNLLIFNTWSSSIEPTTIIPFDVSKWIFSVCIIASFINLGFEHIRARRVMNRGSVAECFLDSLAARLESVRFGKGQGYRRFLVFAELTKSKKGAEYVALFTYFSFQSWIRVIFCSGPRQAVNAMAMLAVYNAKLTTDATTVDRTLTSFFSKLEALAASDPQQAVVLAGMLFTLIIWIFSFLALLLAALLYVFFLWHYIPRQDGGLSGYCERKVNKRLMRIVSVKVNKAIAKEEQQRAKAEIKAAKKAGEKPPLKQQATLPTLPVFMSDSKEDSLPQMPMLGRNDTMATLPLYTSRPGTPGSIEMNALDQKRPMPSRQATSTSQASYSSRAPLIGGAAGMGFDRSQSPAPTIPSLDMDNYPPGRPGTAQSNRSFGPGSHLQRTQTGSSSGFGPGSQLQRTQTGSSSGFGASYTQSPSPYSSATMPFMPPPIRSPTANSMDSYSRPMPRPTNQFPGRPGPAGRPMYDDSANNGRSSPAPSTYSNRGPPMDGQGYNSPQFSPMRSATNPISSPQRPQFQQRNMTAPMPPRQDDYMGPGTAGSERSMTRPGYGYNHDVESQRGPSWR